MRKPLDKSSVQATPGLHVVSPRPYPQPQPPFVAPRLSAERRRIVARLLAVLFEMKPEARENIVRLAEIMAQKHPVAPRLRLVHASSAPCASAGRPLPQPGGAT